MRKWLVNCKEWTSSFSHPSLLYSIFTSGFACGSPSCLIECHFAPASTFFDFHHCNPSSLYEVPVDLLARIMEYRIRTLSAGMDASPLAPIGNASPVRLRPGMRSGLIQESSPQTTTTLLKDSCLNGQDATVLYFFGTQLVHSTRQCSNDRLHLRYPIWPSSSHAFPVLQASCSADDRGFGDVKARVWGCKEGLGGGELG